MRDPETLPYTTYRISLLSGVLGSVGATVAWLFWLAFRIGNRKMVVTVLVAAALGIAVEWTQHYIKVARREKDGATVSPAWRLSRPAAALGWASGLGFVGLIAEHLLEHMAAEFLIPFLASLTTLLPAGLIIGWTMSRGEEKDENLIMMVGNGMLIGAAITLVTGLLWLVSFGTAPWEALFAWWGLIGIGTRMVAKPGRHKTSAGDPAAAVVLVFVLSLLINLLPMTQAPYEKLGPFSMLAMRVRAMAAEIELSPAMPASFWQQAEADFKATLADAAAKAPPPAPPVRPTSSRPPVINLKGAVDRLTAVDSTALVTTPSSRWDAATWAEFIRSWVVMLLFAIGVGVAPAVERSLRPIDYPNSETYRRDLLLTAVVVLVIVISCVGARSAAKAKQATAKATASISTPGV